MEKDLEEKARAEKTAYMREWRKKNAEKVKANNQRYWAKKNQKPLQAENPQEQKTEAERLEEALQHIKDIKAQIAKLEQELMELKNS